MQRKNIFNSIPSDLNEEFFEIIAQNKQLKIERIISKGHHSPASGWHDQAQHEWVMVLKGEAVIYYSSGEEIELKAGDHINIPAHTKHKVSWTSPNTETIWLAVHYED